ncbi:MAG: hypothetical protein A3D52_01255 [Candidatus Taylorbacteria bacterium RIFCSPHIGHO2_02_FULL_44_36]|uniref:Uncharacterized protein n=1 Tax=Candidatus Taylorbacteria bacterium RIFCSPLOWO2_12_FULL_44_15c TaxID=1802333 RepID=A0A1G2P5Q2_9BACT|nr:MAG: hypothetical protein A3D52_01255 [Candidatus Taylorbacteria bacterium RIFCSPHIGHO2_02_FULL_44_36]OHA38887.1 MAG: hypothetical protein A3I97_01375 [Candidatus Taylorbacteria bacterium RIFCSPLOWO2_02_FULL_44_35]OHA43666.1 MAG: hypothetical protein A3G03_03400 [Candidatus Taylorbacteria bacterium RIFCSPLOWO2_12_FULL_44_15c]
MKTVLLNIVVICIFAWLALVIIAAFLQSAAKDRQRASRRVTWEGMILSRAELRDYDKLFALACWHQYLREKINTLVERMDQPDIISFSSEWRQIRLHRLFSRVKENTERYNRLSRQTGFQFQRLDWVPDGEEKLPRQLSILEPAWKS